MRIRDPPPPVDLGVLSAGLEQDAQRVVAVAELSQVGAELAHRSAVVEVHVAGVEALGGARIEIYLLRLRALLLPVREEPALAPHRRGRERRHPSKYVGVSPAEVERHQPAEARAADRAPRAIAARA